MAVNKDYERDLYQKHDGEVAIFPAMPVFLQNPNAGRRIDVERDGDIFWQTGYGESRPFPSGWHIDAEALVDEFAALGSPEAFGEFLKVCGPFNYPTAKQEVSWTQAKELQSFLRNVRLENVLANAVPAWLWNASSFHHPKSMILAQGDDQLVSAEPYLSMVAASAVEMMSMVLWVERKNKVRNQQCDHCKGIFRLRSNHERRFCTPEHARLFSQAEKRRKAREAQEAGRALEGRDAALQAR